MDKDLHELARRLFTVATAILEDATVIAVAGQSHKLTERSCERYARELQLVGRDVQSSPRPPQLLPARAGKCPVNRPRNAAAERIGLHQQSKRCCASLKRDGPTSGPTAPTGRPAGLWVVEALR